MKICELVRCTLLERSSQGRPEVRVYNQEWDAPADQRAGQSLKTFPRRQWSNWAATASLFPSDKKHGILRSQVSWLDIYSESHRSRRQGMIARIPQDISIKLRNEKDPFSEHEALDSTLNYTAFSIQIG